MDFCATGCAHLCNRLHKTAILSLYLCKLFLKRIIYSSSNVLGLEIWLLLLKKFFRCPKRGSTKPLGFVGSENYPLHCDTGICYKSKRPSYSQAANQS
jgi:hypothetical protein